MTARSAARLTQSAGVKKILSRNSWVSLRDFRGVKGTDSSISARIRDLRKVSGGKHVVECRRFADGTYRYRLVK